MQQGAEIGAHLKVGDGEQDNNGEQDAQSAEREKSETSSAAAWRAGSYLLRGISCEAGIGDDFQKSAEGDDVAPLAVSLHAEAAHQDRERYRSDDEPQDAGGAH